MRRRLITVAAVLTLTISGACGFPVDSHARRLPLSRIPAELRAPSPTTTTPPPR